MGATGWNYRVPYQEDLQAALDELRRAAFSKGEYWLGGDFAEGETPRTIEELLARNDGEGAHSILDIDYPCPVSREELIQTFGTNKPTGPMVDALSLLLFDLQGNCLVIYDTAGEDARSKEILFFGFSGD